MGSVQQQHTDEMSQLKAQFEKDKADSLSTMRTSITAEKQVLFNEALKKVCTFIIAAALNETLNMLRIEHCCKYLCSGC